MLCIIIYMSVIFFHHTVTAPHSPLFPYTTLFRSHQHRHDGPDRLGRPLEAEEPPAVAVLEHEHGEPEGGAHREAVQEHRFRSEEHTSELQSHSDLVCRLLLEKKKKKKHTNVYIGI